MTLPVTRHSEQFATAGQIAVSDLPEIAAMGFKTVINNRPDGEGGPTQPLSSDLEQVARENGLSYVYLPVVSGQITPEQVQQMAQVLKQTAQPIFCFCKSGGRSTNLWLMAQQSAA